METYRVVVKEINEVEIAEIINRFIGVGWEYTNIDQHGKGAILRFDWVKECPAIFPDKYKESMAQR